MVVNQCQQKYKMSDKEIKVPNIGEFKDVEVIEVLVSSGQSVLKTDPLITIESDKSSIEIPSSYEGKVKSVKIKVGEQILHKHRQRQKGQHRLQLDPIVQQHNV